MERAKNTKIKLMIKSATFLNGHIIDPSRIHISQEDILASAPDLKEREIYLCGPDLWQEEIKNDLNHLGVATENIKTELYNF